LGGEDQDPFKRWDKKKTTHQKQGEEELQWIFEAGEFTPDNGKNSDDLDWLAGKVKGGTGNIYSGQTGTVIGGSKRWKDYLNDTSSRIDRQMPPPGAFNVQFQVGGNSYGGVIFTLEDDLETVMNQLIAAYGRGMQAVSPSAQRARQQNRPTGNPSGGKKS
jgi:hypothetical protein